VELELVRGVLTNEYTCVQNTITSQLCDDATYLVQKRSANSLQLLKDVSTFVAEEFVERRTINTFMESAPHLSV
jgi:hypothetical protein